MLVCPWEFQYHNTDINIRSRMQTCASTFCHCLLHQWPNERPSLHVNIYRRTCSLLLPFVLSLVVSNCIYSPFAEVKQDAIIKSNWFQAPDPIWVICCLYKTGTLLFHDLSIYIDCLIVMRYEIIYIYVNDTLLVVIYFTIAYNLFRST